MATLLDIMDAFTSSMSRAKVTYILYSGALLGSWRHHGIIPWDDDIDLWIDRNHRYKLDQVVEGMGDEYAMSKTQQVRNVSSRPY